MALSLYFIVCLFNPAPGDRHISIFREMPPRRQKRATTASGGGGKVPRPHQGGARYRGGGGEPRGGQLCRAVW